MAEQTEQAVETTVSVEDRIADIFAGKEPEEQPKEAAAEEVQADEESSEDTPEDAVSEGSEGFVEVEFNGVQYQVPPEIKDALMRETDYTQKTQLVSNQRRELELQQKQLELAHQQQQFNQNAREEVSQLEMLDAYIQHVNQNTNWQSMSTDEAFRAKLELDQLKDQREQIRSSLQAKYDEFNRELETKRRDIDAESNANLAKAIPGWNEQVRTSVQDYVKSLGYSDLLTGNMSSLDYQVAYKAMQFDQLKAKTGSAVKKAASAPIIKPTARNEMPKSVQKKLNYRNQLKKTSDPRAREKLASERIADIFGG